MKNYNFINDNVKLDFPIPQALQEIMDMAEEADRNNNLAAYENHIDFIGIVAKNCCADGSLSYEQWQTICRRYV